MKSVEAIYPYQQAGVEWLAERRTAFLADEMGLGKTVQAIRGADIIGAKKILVICPAVARIQWAREFERWQTVERSVFSWVSPPHGNPDVVIVSNAGINQGPVAEKLQECAWDLLILDEAQAFKSQQAKRTVAIYGKDGLCRKTARTWLLSGTPMPNHPGELWTHLRVLFGETLDYPDFLNRYCITAQGDYGLRVLGSRNLGELKDKLRPHLLRRRTSEVLRELPPIAFGEVVVRAENSAGIVAAMMAKLGTIDPEALATCNQEHLSALRRMIGILKAPAVAELIMGELTADPLMKLVCFAHHLDVLDTLQESCSSLGVVRIDGATRPVMRQEAIDTFQNKPDVRLFLGQIQACSTAITLTAANRVLFAEASWTPGDNVQAAKRCHRIGQTRPVLARFVTLDGTIDDAVNRVLARKARMLTELWDNQEEPG